MIPAQLLVVTSNLLAFPATRARAAPATRMPSCAKYTAVMMKSKLLHLSLKWCHGSSMLFFEAGLRRWPEQVRLPQTKLLVVATFPRDPQPVPPARPALKAVFLCLVVYPLLFRHTNLHTIIRQSKILTEGNCLNKHRCAQPGPAGPRQAMAAAGCSHSVRFC